MNSYLIKFDLSGIMPFVFNVPNTLAMRALKNRSVYVQNISDDLLKKIQDYFNIKNEEPLYNSSGTFYLEVNTDKDELEIDNFLQSLENPFIEQDIYPYFTYIEKKSENFGELFESVNKSMQKAKLHRQICFDLIDNKRLQIPDIDIKTIKGINGQVLDGDFDYITQQSEGDKKIAAIKLDVDNLNSLFHNKTKNEYKKISDSLKDFFDQKLLQLIKDLKMQQSVFVVYSGGGNAFLIGSWNHIFDLSIEIKEQFNKFNQKLKSEISSIKDITFSAGIIIFTARLPMIQLQEEVEEALMSAKRAINKDSVCCFGKTVLWNEFIQSQKIVLQLVDLIKNRGESKSLLERIKASDIGFDKIQQDANRGIINIPKVWRLKYFLRNVKKNNEEAVRKLFDAYTKAILDAFVNRKTTNPELYPIAARWAELLMKK